MTSTRMGAGLVQPTRAARVFLSHSWADNPASDYLYEQLQLKFKVWYDRAAALGHRTPMSGRIGNQSLARAELAQCDYFLFLASPSSMSEFRYAREELSIAESLFVKKHLLLGTVCLEDFVIAPEYQNRVFGIFRWATRRADSAKIAGDVAWQLSGNAGLRLAPPNSFNAEILGGERALDLLEETKPGCAKGIYALNAVYVYAEMARLVEVIRDLPDAAKSEKVDLLLSVYGNDAPEHHLARQNAAFLISKVMVRDPSIARFLRRRYPSDDLPFFYRNFHVSLGLLGDQGSFQDYVYRLAKEPGSTWDMQRRANREFFALYYGSSAGALAELRETIRQLKPAMLLPLNVVTLGQSSRSLIDRELLEEQRNSLVAHGVDARLIKYSLSKLTP